MAIDIMQERESVSGGEAVAIFREVLGEPEMKEGVFYNLVSEGKIAPLPNEKRGKQRYPRADVVRVAEERLRDQEELKSLLSLKQVAARIRSRGITVKDREIERMAESGRLPTWKRYGRYRYFRPEDIDRVIVQLIDIQALKEQTKDLFETMEAVNWINNRLEEMAREQESEEEDGEEPRSPRKIELSTIYKQVERGIIEPDMIIPAGEKNRAVRFYWSKQTLEKHPIFEIPPEMPDFDEVQPVRVTGSKVLRSLEERWGDLATRHGLKEDGLSVHFVSKSDRTVVPVGYDGPVQWFPVKYIPKKQRRRSNDLKEIKELLSEG